MHSWEKIRQNARKTPSAGVAVACADDPVILSALEKASKEGICHGFLVGNSDRISKEAKSCGLSMKKFEIIDADSEKEAAATSVTLVKEGKASFLMKGMLSTSTLLKAVLDKDCGLRTGSLLSHILAAEIKGRMYLITDGGVNLYPDLNQKADIIRNAVKTASALGSELPAVACLCAVETVNPEMPCTSDASILSLMNERGQIRGCVVDGPLALDNAVSEEAARHKKIVSPVAGKADILLLPDIESGNILGKSLIYFAKIQAGGIIAGAKAPIILLSRADDDETKLNSICLAKAVSHK